MSAINSNSSLALQPKILLLANDNRSLSSTEKFMKDKIPETMCFRCFIHTVATAVASFQGSFLYMQLLKHKPLKPLLRLHLYGKVFV